METPFQLHFLHCSAALRQSLARFDADKWLVHWHDSSSSGDGTNTDTKDDQDQDHRHVTDIAASPADIVYLSPDSPNVLTTLDKTKTYVIGGIVDKSRKKVGTKVASRYQFATMFLILMQGYFACDVKGATLNVASSVGITTARLPIQEYISERLDHILNVNTVVEVLISFQETGGDWERALRLALPQVCVAT